MTGPVSDVEDHVMDLTNPASWYPHTRSMQRKIIAHVGPTNSGLNRCPSKRAYSYLYQISEPHYFVCKEQIVLLGLCLSVHQESPILSSKVCRLMISFTLIPAPSEPGLLFTGKTYQALQALKSASSGAYCSPLRLLAWEVSPSH